MQTLSLPLPFAAPRTRVARWVVAAARIALGLIFFVFGLNGFFFFLPGPSAPMPEGAMAFFGGMMATGYLLPLLAGTEVLVGALLLVNRFVPLALVLLAPVALNIFLFHAFVMRAGLELAVVILVLGLGLAWAHRAAYRSLFIARR